MADRFERLTNLVAALLDTPRPLTLEEIVHRVPGYPPEPESARRQFERDKESLRELSIPIELVEDPYQEIVGYRIDRQKYELPELDLTPEERAALHAAVSAMHLQDGEGRQALWKLGGPGGPEVPTLGALPSVSALPALMDATRRQVALRFNYRGVTRVLEPYAVLFHGGNWYVMGNDLDRDDIRSFRADRIEGEPKAARESTFDRPPGFEPAALLHDEPWRYGDEPPVEAQVGIDAALSGWARQRLGEGAVVRETDDGGVVVRLTVTNTEAFRSFVLDLLDHAEVLEPPELRDDITAWLRNIAGTKR